MTDIELKKQIEELELKIEDLEELGFSSGEHGEKVYRPIFILREKIKELQRMLSLNQFPAYSNGVLDLYLDESADKVGKVSENYNITLTGEKRFIGYVRVTYDNMSDNFLGNIGYELKREFRGNGYMLQALEILREPMLKKGLEKPVITVQSDNIPSVRTIEKFGGKKLDKDEWYDSYEVDLEEKTNRSK